MGGAATGCDVNSKQRAWEIGGGIGRVPGTQYLIEEDAW